MYSDNPLNKYIQIQNSLKENADFDIRDAQFKKLVKTAVTNPLEFTATVAQAFTELDKEFNKRRADLQQAIGDVVIEMVKQGDYPPPKV